MEPITSFDNKKIKLASSLSEKKHRDETGLFAAEGIRWLSDAVKSGHGAGVEFLLVSDLRVPPALPDDIIGKIPAEKIHIVSDNIFSKISDTENSQGVLAVFRKPAEKTEISSAFAVYLDRIRDPGNMGTILRTACAAGFNSVICGGCVDVYNPKVIRSSMGAIFDVDVCQSGSLETLAALKEKGYKVISADMDGIDIFSKNALLAAKSEKLCLIIGSEADGIDSKIRAMSDIIVKIPMENMESLNAAVSFAVLAYKLKFG